MLGDFEAILEANMVTYNLKLVLEFGALLKLRQAEPELPRPYKIPLGMPGLCLLFAPPVSGHGRMHDIFMYGWQICTTDPRKHVICMTLYVPLLVS
jgi:hypothetical protein